MNRHKFTPKQNATITIYSETWRDKIIDGDSNEHFACYPRSISISEPITEISGGPDLFINEGSTINLTCLVKYSPEPPPTMVWSHNSQVINFDSPRGGVSLVTEKGATTTSRLLIQKAVQADSGTYTCTPSNANGASVRVHILNGKWRYCVLCQQWMLSVALDNAKLNGLSVIIGVPPSV